MQKQTLRGTDRLAGDRRFHKSLGRLRYGYVEANEIQLLQQTLQSRNKPKEREKAAPSARRQAAARGVVLLGGLTLVQAHAVATNSAPARVRKAVFAPASDVEERFQGAEKTAKVRERRVCNRRAYAASVERDFVSEPGCTTTYGGCWVYARLLFLWCAFVWCKAARG